MEYSNFIINRFKDLFGGEYKNVLDALSRPPRKAIRINTLKTSVQSCLRRLESRGYRFSQVPWSRYSFFVDNEPRPLPTTMEYLNGFFYIQDPTSLIPVIELAPRKEQLVLDMAASPGGKTTHNSQIMGNKGVVVALDVNNERMESLQSNLNRLGVENVISIRMDSRKVSELRIKVGSGYRVYYTKKENEIIILLVGGDKSTQSKDIAKAQQLCKELENE